MTQALFVGIGGFIGAVLRHGVNVATTAWLVRSQFPVGTLLVNVLGCFLIGLLAHVSEIRGPFTPEIRAFIMVGMLGGFTTFSAFGNETFALWRDGAPWPAAANVVAHIILGLGAVGMGRLVGLKLWG